MNLNETFWRVFFRTQQAYKQNNNTDKRHRKTNTFFYSVRNLKHQIETVLVKR